MKISYNWLKDYININLEVEETSRILTDIGLEVEGIEKYEEVKGGLKGLVVGEVLTCQKHPNADKLTLTTVNVGGGDPLNIVCGAPNVEAGQKVVVATIGAELFMGDKSFTIKKTKIRGELSEGMICAEDEIGMGNSHEGIMVLESNAEVGTTASEYFNLQTDTVFEIGLTPNRIDAGSHFGVARDLAAYLSQHSDVELKKPDISAFKSGDDSYKIDVEVKDNVACPRYTGLTIKDVNVGPSPSWLQNKLKAIGLSPINNVVDITNFVLHELGQPLHAFDADQLKGNKIVVRKMQEGTKFITLDEVERKLSSEDLIICDSENGACIAGVFGGISSGVTDSTKNIFLESAYFDPVSTRKTAKRHGLSTDSSFRFERGVDPDQTVVALKRAALLIQDIAGGKVTSDVTDIYPNQIKAFNVTMNYTSVDKLIGKQLERKLIRNILSALDIKVISEEEDVAELEVPPYRVDVTREADVVEEILRIYGYNNVEFSNKIHASYSVSNKPDIELLVNQVSDYLASNGFNEIMSNSLSKKDYYKDLKTYPEEKCVPLLNPLSSDLNIMRQTILFSGLEAIAYNINRQNPNLKLFEYGTCYRLTNKKGDENLLTPYTEQQKYGLFLSGNKVESTWTSEDKEAGFFHLKAYCEKILNKLGIAQDMATIEVITDKEDIYNGGLVYSFNGSILLEIGDVNANLLKQFDIEQNVIFAELNWENIILNTSYKVSFKEMPKFPEVRRDLALLLDENIKYSEIEDLALQVEKKLLKRVNLFDYYKGKGIPKGKKSYAVSFYLQNEEKTLTDKEIERIMNRISEKLLSELKAELR